MTTKQPPAQKHLEIAKKTIEYWQDTHSFKIPCDIKHDMIIELGESLAETEAAALASKVVGPSDEEITDQALLEGNEPCPVCGEGTGYAFYVEGAKWYRSQLSLAPKEQVIRVPVIGLKEFESKVLENGFDHPCRKTCSGWAQGYDRGRFDFQEAIKRLNPTARIEESNE